MDITGVILAGGKSSRMGTDKGLLLLNGKPMVQYVIDALSKVVSKIIIISNNEAYKQFGLDVFPDLVKEKGPVGGIYTALSYSSTESNICVSCDTPFITEKLLNLLIENSANFDITVSRYKDKIHPLIGVYKKSILDTFKKSLDKNQLKLSLVNKNVEYNVVEVEGGEVTEMNFYNINTQIDLKTIENDS